MATSRESKPLDTADSEVWNAIGIFEQILEAMPEDRASLEALAHAYEQVGDHVRAKQYSVRLLKQVLGEGELQTAAALADKLKPYAADDPDLQALVDRVQATRDQAPPAPPPPAKPEEKGDLDDKAAEGSNRRPASSISDELALAWHLLQNNEMSQDEYAKVVQDLTELSAESESNSGTISVLHALQARASKNLERIMVFMSKDSRVPIICLSGFELRMDVCSRLPLSFVIRRGALVFEIMARSPLVVVMNPYDKQLRSDVEQAAGHSCHFYLTLPSDFDAAVDKIKGMKKE